MFRMSGEDAPEYAGTYEDVQAEDWFAGALTWALEAGVLEGVFAENGVFAPQRPVTRVELAGKLGGGRRKQRDCRQPRGGVGQGGGNRRQGRKRHLCGMRRHLPVFL